MKPIIFIFISSASFWPWAAMASPSSWAPSSIDHSVAANCETLSAKVSYQLIPKSLSNGTFEIKEITVARVGAREQRLLTAEPLPTGLVEIDTPFVERVVPICSEGDKFSFVFYISATKDVNPITFVSRGPVTRLYLDIAKDNSVSLYSRAL